MESLAAQHFRSLYQKLFAPIPKSLNASAKGFNDSAITYSVQVGIAWTLRLYQDYFPTNEAGPLSMLQGLLTVPIQFSTTAWQIVDIDSLPPDLNTIASMTKITYRAIGKRWAISVFGGLALFLVLWAMAFLAWICRTTVEIPNTSLFPEIDISSKCRVPAVQQKAHSQKTEISESWRDFAEFLQSEVGNNSTSETVKKCLKGKRIHCRVLKVGEQNMVILHTGQSGLGELLQGMP
jgi:hypothetical protein